MKKALISAAAAAALLGAGVAQAQVTAYGLFDISVGKSIYGDINGNDIGLHSGGDGSASEGNSTTRFGLKGSTDVGSGIKANFNYQAGITGNGSTNGKVGANDGSAAGSSSVQLFNRQAWGGLSGGFGEVRFGLQDSVPFQTFINLDYNGASNGVSAAVYTNAGLWAKSRQGNSLQYISPSLGGLTVQVGYVMGGSQDYADGASFKDGDDPDDRSTWTGADDKDTKNLASVGLTYVVGPVTLAAAMQQSGKDDDATTTKLDESAAYAGFGAQYDFGSFKVKADYQKQDTLSGINLGAVTTVAGWSVGVNYSIATDKSDDAGTTVKTSGYELFTNKEVLKNVYGYAEIGSGKADSDGAETYTGFAVGMILVF